MRSRCGVDEDWELPAVAASEDGWIGDMAIEEGLELG
jgi:hypothetical protein